MSELSGEKMCPRCGSLKLKDWDELADDELFVAKRVVYPLPAEQGRNVNRICTGCWLLFPPPERTLA